MCESFGRQLETLGFMGGGQLSAPTAAEPKERQAPTKRRMRPSKRVKRVLAEIQQLRQPEVSKPEPQPTLAWSGPVQFTLRAGHVRQQLSHGRFRFQVELAPELTMSIIGDNKLAGLDLTKDQAIVGFLQIWRDGEQVLSAEFMARHCRPRVAFSARTTKRPLSEPLAGALWRKRLTGVELLIKRIETPVLQLAA